MVRKPLRRTIPAALGAVLMAGIMTTYVLAVDRAAPRASGAPDFRLVDPTGRAYSIDSFPANSVLAIYFGYTTCLRACPIALDTIAAAMDDLGAQGTLVRPVFIDMDPERAALLSLPLYMQSFGPDFLGLTGSPEAVEEAARAFKVEVKRLQLSADPTDYAMTHVSPIFVMRPGHLHPMSLPATSPPDAIAAALRNALEANPSG